MLFPKQLNEKSPEGHFDMKIINLVVDNLH